jgi:DNA-binding Lrp family transcriptional regulator
MKQGRMNDLRQQIASLLQSSSMSTPEIADRLGVSRQYARALLIKMRDDKQVHLVSYRRCGKTVTAVWAYGDGVNDEAPKSVRRSSRVKFKLPGIVSCYRFWGLP